MASSVLVLLVLLPLVISSGIPLPLHPDGPGIELPLTLADSGVSLVVDEVIRGPPGVPWIRVFFSELQLPDGALMVLTSTHDGAQQHLDHRVAAQWQQSTAYFNGDSVEVKVFAGTSHPLLASSPAVYQAAFGGAEETAAADGVLRMRVEWIQHGLVKERNAKESICFSPDTRVFSNDTRQGRCMSLIVPGLMARGCLPSDLFLLLLLLLSLSFFLFHLDIYGDPNGCCTAWMINDANHCFLSAGHCTEAGKGLVEFMVPMSADDGTLVHPPPIHQYIVDQASMQTQYAGTADWRYFGVFMNGESGLHPLEAYKGDYYRLRVSEPVSTSNLLRITGYGENESFPPSHRRVLKTATGSFRSTTSGTVSYRVDTTNGNSGSAVFDEATGVAIGIHTLGGCQIGSSNSANSGVNILLSTLQTALQNPRGVCASKKI